ncbi:Predicted ATPase of the ABC class [Evansella caseinilytica]|uniref:Predicted ATPase of the ABC class n=1 Tax=Evansella caseinilytica TaxID=1503961 RepID=A0A1H3G511_9BACI|nr:ABC-ATPase domain-containing protein [Evansella caseinilytica]SDX98331.1 Predicted ATPase of the ABC class [Evansella caseinilytica]
MKTNQELGRLLSSIEGQKYSDYKRMKGMYDFGKYQLAIDHVQVDPFAPPSKMRIIMNRNTAGIPAEWLDSKTKIIAVSDFLTRAFWKAIQPFNKTAKGTGSSGLILIDRCGQEILERTSVLIKADSLEVRFEIGLPAAGRRILGKAAARIFEQTLPQVVEQALLYHNLDQKAMKNQVVLMLDQAYIREELTRKQLVAFVADGSVLPRESGVSDKPLTGAIPFTSPKSLEIQLTLPSGKTITGMGIPEGITLIVGGGYHGKSTLLRALELGVYNHISGDGREMVITRQDAVKIRAEDGRNVEKVNISAFINNLPGNKNTHQFSTENASGSTSQAANVMEALETGTSLLLIDEDTSATNFMIRDGRMQKLISPDKEPITPFSHKVKPLYERLGVSTILIVGGSGDYFDVADHIIMMDEYRLKDVTAAAKTIASTAGYQRESVSTSQFGDISSRIPLQTSFSRTGKENRIKSKGRHTILYGREMIDISGLEQLIDDSQTNCIAVMIDFFKKEIVNDKWTISQAADRIYAHIARFGLDAISPYTGHPGNLALPRKQEFCAALHRYRGLKIKD